MEMNKVGCSKLRPVFVDVIIPVHNAAKTIVQTVQSALHQTVPQQLATFFKHATIDVAVCCYDDGSCDESWPLLNECEKIHKENQKSESSIRTHLFLERSPDGVARGAGFARNRAASLRSNVVTVKDTSFLCLLDSDDIMHETRVAQQVHGMLSLDTEERHRTILGCNFDRDPPDSTWHYSNWANGLSDERLSLERFREVTVLQPTWMMTKSRFWSLGGYIESPHPRSDEGSAPTDNPTRLVSDNGILHLVHPTYDTPRTLRLAEDLRFFHAHLYAGGLLRLHRTEVPLLTYRHRCGMSQSSQTPRKLLLQLRVLAFELTILSKNPRWKTSFVVWGAGRDGKDFVKALSPESRRRVVCMVDVDDRKIRAGYYVNQDIRIPIVHFSLLAADPSTRQKLIEAWEEGLDDEAVFGRIDKGRSTGGNMSSTVLNDATDKTLERPRKRRRVAKNVEHVAIELLPSLPVVVCVAMYRTNGALEANVKSIGRTEGEDLWHFS